MSERAATESATNPSQSNRSEPPVSSRRALQPESERRVDKRVFATEAMEDSVLPPIARDEEIEPHVAVTFGEPEPPHRAPSSRPPSSRPPPSRPSIAGRYRLDRRLAEGGMGIVYAGWHVTLDQPVAVKVIRRELVDNAEAVQRFIEEARALAQLRGPHVAQVLDAGIEDGSPFIVMELLQGQDLRTLLEERRQLALSEAAQLVREACEAVAEAHAKGIVHRDLKPENLFLAEDESGASTLKVIDFGISARQGADGALHQQTGPGSPEYMAPEQLVPGSNVDQRADIWSLGVVLYELVTGRAPFVGETEHELCSGVVHGSPPRLSELRPGLPEAFEALVMRCLDKSADGRFATASEMGEALKTFEARLALRSDPATPVEAPQPADVDDELTPAKTAAWLERPRPWRLAVGVAAGAALGISLYFHSRSEPPAADADAAPTRSEPPPARAAADEASGPIVAPVTEGPSVTPTFGSEADDDVSAPAAAWRWQRRAAAASKTEREQEQEQEEQLDEQLDSIGEVMAPLATDRPASAEEAAEARYALAASKLPPADAAAKKAAPKAKDSAASTPSSSGAPTPSTATFPDAYE